MTAFERGPLQDFEVVWNNGYSEVIQAHQVSYRGGENAISAMFGASVAPEVVQFHAEVAGRWTLILRVLGSDLRSVRNLTQTEQRQP